MNLHWEHAAESDLANLLDYIAHDNLTAAYEVYDLIKQQAENLRDYPNLGRVGRIKGTRELVIAGTPYIAAYSIKGETVRILRVLHGAQSWDKYFKR